MAVAWWGRPVQAMERGAPSIKFTPPPTVIVPNRLAVCHGWQGNAGKKYVVPTKQVRPCGAKKFKELKELMFKCGLEYARAPGPTCGLTWSARRVGTVTACTGVDSRGYWRMRYTGSLS